MREIKFRAFINRSMYYTYECGVSGNRNLLEILEGVDYDSLMQFTGLLDKNGKEIYEGDIVDAWSTGQNAKCEVKWGNGIAGFFLYANQGGIVWHLSGGGIDNRDTVEIIGNIYENPELLK